MGKMSQKIISLILALFFTASMEGYTQNSSFSNGREYVFELYQSMERVVNSDAEIAPFTFHDLFNLSEYFSRKKQAKEAHDSFKQKTLDLQRHSFVIKDGSILLQCPDIEDIKAVLAYESGNEVTSTYNSKIAGDDVVVVSFYSGSGIIRKRALIFKQEPDSKQLTLVMMAMIGADASRVSSIPVYDDTMGLWEMPVTKEMEDYYIKMQSDM